MGFPPLMPLVCQLSEGSGEPVLKFQISDALILCDPCASQTPERWQHPHSGLSQDQRLVFENLPVLQNKRLTRAAGFCPSPG